MTTITYDSVSIYDLTNLITRIAAHDSSPDRLLSTVRLTKRDGEIIVDDNFAPKTITIEGVIRGSSEADMETRLDALKALCARKDKNLDISYAGGTRRYVCRMTKLNCVRDSYNIYHAPYSIVFFVASGIGKDTAETTAQNTTGITAETTNASISFAGSYDPKPKHRVTLTTRGNADVVRLMNVTTGDYIEVDLDGFSNGDYFEVDEENQTVKKNGSTNLDWRGKFPSVTPGSNSLRMIIYGPSYTLDQTDSDLTGGGGAVIYDNVGATILPWQAQSFVPTRSGRIGKIAVHAGKVGSPGGKMQWLLYSDNNGKPGSVLAGSGAFDKLAASLGSPGFVDATITTGSAYLVQGRRYWLVLNPGVVASTDSSNYYLWSYSTNAASYLLGKALARKLSSTDWLEGTANAQTTPGGVDLGQKDMTFGIYFGDGGSPSFTVAWKIDYTKKYL